MGRQGRDAVVDERGEDAPGDLPRPDVAVVAALVVALVTTVAVAAVARELRLEERDALVEGEHALDERIALLEAELARESSDSDSDGSDDDDSNDDSGDVKPKKVARGVLASLVDDRIPPLPAHLLPQAPPKKRHFDGPPPRTKPGTPDAAFARASPAQLQQAHRLVDACAASEKVKRELYCRLCAFQGADLADLERHRRSDLHLLATRVWRDRSYCKLCRVQTTSPNELAVHLKCKKHKERLAEVEGRGRGGGRGRGRGRGRGGRF